MPIKPNRFEYYLKRWPLETNNGAIEVADLSIVTVNDKPMITKFWAMNAGSIYMDIDKRENLKKKWDNFIIDFKRTAPDGLKSVSHSSYDFWPKSEALILYKTASGYLCVPIIFILLILLVKHRSKAMIAFCSFLCICVILITSVGLTIVDGWIFNEISYMSYILMFSLSSNYTIMISMNFANCPIPSRADRLQYAITQSAPTILWCTF